MTQRYYYHEHQSDYAVVKAKGLKLRAALYGHPDFEAFSSRSYLEATLPRLEVPQDARVLELGCGTGPGACFLAKRG
jgi:cyclopropane fatty-acyl-phospholipid synthase-like methyltransferase